MSNDYKKLEIYQNFARNCSIQFAYLRLSHLLTTNCSILTYWRKQMYLYFFRPYALGNHKTNYKPYLPGNY